jgi:hypothetical protein
MFLFYVESPAINNSHDVMGWFFDFAAILCHGDDMGFTIGFTNNKKPGFLRGQYWGKGLVCTVT